MTLKVTQNGTNDLFEAPSDEARPLGTEEWIPLGSIQYGGTTTLNVTLKVPIEMNDEFQDAIGYVDWEFKAEEVPYIPPHDDPSPSPGPGKAVKQPVQPAPAAAPPKTGDISNVMLWVALMMVSAAAAVVIAAKIRKQK